MTTMELQLISCPSYTFSGFKLFNVSPTSIPNGKSWERLLELRGPRQLLIICTIPFHNSDCIEVSLALMTVVTRCQIFRLKCTKFCLGPHPPRTSAPCHLTRNIGHWRSVTTGTPNGICIVLLQGFPLEFLCHLEFCADRRRDLGLRIHQTVSAYSLQLCSVSSVQRIVTADRQVLSRCSLFKLVSKIYFV